MNIPLLNHTRESLVKLKLSTLQKLEVKCYQVNKTQYKNQHSLICEVFLEKLKIKSLNLDDRISFYNRVRTSILKPFFKEIVEGLTDEEKLKLVESIAAKHALLIIEKIDSFLSKNKIFNFKVADRLAEVEPALVLKNLDKFKLNKYHVKRYRNVSFRHNAKDILFQLKADALNESAMIKEHARRRVEFFFYTAMGVYNDGYEYTLGNTVLQYGKGVKKKTEGAHSTLITNLGRRKIGSKDGLDYSFYSRLFMFHAINSTCEVDLKVNDIDSNLEGKKESDKKLRAIAIKILNKVADPGNGCTPEDAVVKLLKKKDKIFRPLIKDPDKRKIALLQKKGMDLIKKRDGSIEGDFFKWNILLTIPDSSLPDKDDYKGKQWETYTDQEKDLLFNETYKEILTHRFLG